MNHDQHKDPDNEKGISWIALILSIFVLALYFWFVVRPDGEWKYGQEQLGQLGDFIGGLTNPLIGIVTVYLILTSIRIQRKELRSASAAFEKQNAVMFRQTFEQTFFSWLESYRQLVSQVSIYDGDEMLTGRNAMAKTFNDYLTNKKVLREIKELLDDDSYAYFKNFRSDSNPENSKISKIIVDKWGLIYKELRYDIDTTFRTLYRLIKWIDEQPVELLDQKTKWHYVAIARSQISHIEMLYLFYNGFTKRGERFNTYINRYALFDNIDTNGPIRKFLLNLPYEDSAKLGYKPFTNCAFNSDLARSQFQ